MADYERTVLEHYKLPSAFPTIWPDHKEDSDGSDDEALTETRTTGGTSIRSGHKAADLKRTASTRQSVLAGLAKPRETLQPSISRDEPDPLGAGDSIVRILRTQGVPVQDDPTLRNRYLLSSPTFNPAAFLSQVHRNDSTQQLLQGLDILTRSVDQKSASLKTLVESNFEKFVRAKSTIDSVYEEMKTRGTESQLSSPVKHHSRQASKSSFKNSTFINQTKRKNALTPETEYGVVGINSALKDVSKKADQLWGPALDSQEREEQLRVASRALERFRDTYELPAAIAESIKSRNHEALVDEYRKAARIADDAKRLAEHFKRSRTPPSDSQVHQLIIAARMWHDVQEQVDAYKRELWRRLAAVQYSGSDPLQDATTAKDQHLELIGILLELGVEDNPIWVWLLSRYDHLKSKIATTSSRAKAEIEVLRRRLINAPKPTPQVLARHVQSLSRESPDSKTASLDTPDILELWDRIHNFLTGLLSSSGILGEILEFYRTVQSFIEGKAQRTLPTGYNGDSRKHHRLSDQGIIDLRKGVIELTEMVRESISSFISDPPLEDLSALQSPNPGAPSTPRDSRFAFDAVNTPPQASRLGEPWEAYAFWPPWANSHSGVHNLAKLLTIVGSAAGEMAAISPPGRSNEANMERLRGLVSSARERCVKAICAAWNKDAENIKTLEDWKRSSERKELTKMPSNFAEFESAVLSGLQRMLYIPEAIVKPGTEPVVLPPPTKLLVMVRSQFVTTLYKALSGMVENAESSGKQANDEWNADEELLVVPYGASSTTNGSSNVERDIRMLLTLSNLQELRSEVVPSLTTQFENAFSVKLTDETKTIRDVLGQIDARLFRSYADPIVEELRAVVTQGILDPAWVPKRDDRPDDVKPYVYEALLRLVLVHSQVSTTTPTLTTQILSFLLEQLSMALLETFKKRNSYPLSSLMQATFDVEFVAQTLSQYTTDRAGSLHMEIYQELDKATDNESRKALQIELQDMRTVLRRLRETTKSEFACFKRSRKAAEQAPAH